MENKAYYNRLLINKSNQPTHSNWQTEDYRTWSFDDLFATLNVLDFPMDQVSFLALAEEANSPEEFTAELLKDHPNDNLRDPVYLLVFELWRKLQPEKQTLALFCDEFDYQIEHYENGDIESVEAVQDMIANLAVILDENSDQGENPQQVFSYVAGECAHDLESFLYNFIADQIDHRNDSYAAELLEDFGPYVRDTIWFDALQLRLLLLTNDPQIQDFTDELLKDVDAEKDLELSLEVLSCLTQGGDRDSFRSLLSQTLPMLRTEEDLQDLLTIFAEFFHFLDRDHDEMVIRHIMEERAKIDPKAKLHLSKAEVSSLISMV